MPSRTQCLVTVSNDGWEGIDLFLLEISLFGNRVITYSTRVRGDGHSWLTKATLHGSERLDHPSQLRYMHSVSSV
jgi:hypothetical protein